MALGGVIQGAGSLRLPLYHRAFLVKESSVSGWHSVPAALILLQHTVDAPPMLAG